MSNTCIACGGVHLDLPVHSDSVYRRFQICPVTHRAINMVPNDDHEARKPLIFLSGGASEIDISVTAEEFYQALRIARERMEKLREWRLIAGENTTEGKEGGTE